MNNFRFCLVTLLCLHMVIGINGQIIPDCPDCPNDCPNGFTGTLSWPDVWCRDDTAQLVVTWSSNVVPLYINWHALDTLDHDGFIIGLDNWDTCKVFGMANYCVDITDTSGCNFCIGGIWPGLLPYTPTIDTLIVPSFCNEASGSIETLISNPYPGEVHTYLWSDGNNTPNAFGLEGGSYMVTVNTHNINGWDCAAEFTIEVPNVNDLELTATITMDSFCDENHGFIDLTVFPPDLTYEYNWSNGASLSDLFNVGPGIYSVTVTGPDPCIEEETFIVTDESVPIDSLTFAITPAFCDLATGSIDLTVYGGVGAYTYHWSNGDQAQDPGHLTEGEYEVTVTGFGECEATISVTIPEIDSVLTLSGHILANTSCSFPNGEIILTPSPDGAYFYDWLSGQTTQDLIDVAGGNYAVTMTAGSCEVSENFVVPEQLIHPVLQFSTMSSTCGLPNGSINLSVTNGVTPYTYLWSTGSNLQDLTNLNSGIYIVTMTSGNGCVAIDSVMVNLESTFSFSGQVIPNTSCTTPNGSIQLTIAPPGQYSYSWTSGETTEDLFSIGGGVYSVTITQDTACVLTETYTVPDQLPEVDTLILFSKSCEVSDTGVSISHLQNQAGCDSIIIHYVDLSPSDVFTFISSTCDPQSSGTFTET